MPKQKTSLVYLLFSAIILCALLYALKAFLLPSTPVFPPTLLINLDNRTDRLQEIQQDFHSWPVPIERVSAVKRTPGYKGCSLSHLKCIQIAKDRNYPWVLILEDDCMLMTNAKERFQAILPYLWTNRSKWDMFNGGITALSKHTIIDRNRKIFQVNGYAANFYVVHSSVYDRLLGNHPVEPTEPIDVYYDKNFRIWTIVPYLAKQRPSRSDIENEDKDYSKFFNKAETTLMQSLG
jgi:glycosyl transferase family 25